MERDTLEAILAIEREIRDQLDGERARARQWLDGVRHEAEQARLAEVARLEASVARQERDAKQSARDRADEVVRRAAAEARRIEDADAGLLTAAVRRHISCITPGMPRDH